MRLKRLVVVLFTLSATFWGVGRAWSETDATTSPTRPLLDASIVGSSSCEEDLCYSRVMARLPVQRLLLRLAAGPLDSADVATILGGVGNDLEDLLGLRLIRKDGGRYVLNFALFAAEDQRRIRESAQRWAASLAAAVLERRDEIELALSVYEPPGVDRGDVAFFLLGCASLDWDGLVVTAEREYRATTGERPDGRYVPVALEITDRSLERIYWGSHNARVDGIGLTSFGDHHTLPRVMFPDLMWSTPGFRAGLPEPVRASLDDLVEVSFRRSAATLARVMVALRDDEKDAEALISEVGAAEEDVRAVLDVLVALGYVDRSAKGFRIRIPVLGPSDETMARRVLAIGREVMEAWLAKNFEAIRMDLEDLSFTSAGVPFEEGFTMIWHYIFGLANQQLVEAGFFADPYASDRRFKGAVPVVNALDLDM